VRSSIQAWEKLSEKQSAEPMALTEREAERTVPDCVSSLLSSFMVLPEVARE
jgi:hypothetical protein